MTGIKHELYDKRLQKPIVYRVNDLGQDIAMQEILTYKMGKCQIRFHKPNSTSIFLNSSENELNKAKEIYNKLILNKLSKRQRFELSREENVLLFDYLEHIQSAIVMAFTAIECLVNELLPRDFVFCQTLKTGEVKEWNKADIERWMSTTDKVSLILPTVFNITKPTTYKFWPKFTKLKDLRNDIIHSRSILPIELEENERIFSLLINDSVFGKVKSAFELINKIHSEIPPHNSMPIIKDTETITPIEIPTWDSLGVIRTD